jgi:hypothetical protein
MVRTPVREREREIKRGREREREREEKEINRKMMAALKGMTGALAPFSYLVFSVSLQTSSSGWCHDTLHNDIQQNSTQH